MRRFSTAGDRCIPSIHLPNCCYSPQVRRNPKESGKRAPVLGVRHFEFSHDLHHEPSARDQGYLHRCAPGIVPGGMHTSVYPLHAAQKHFIRTFALLVFVRPCIF